MATTPNNSSTVPPVNNLSGKDVVDFGREVGRDSAKQSLVWIIAGLATQGMRIFIDKVTKSRVK